MKFDILLDIAWVAWCLLWGGMSIWQIAEDNHPVFWYCLLTFWVILLLIWVADLLARIYSFLFEREEEKSKSYSIEILQKKEEEQENLTK